MSMNCPGLGKGWQLRAVTITVATFFSCGAVVPGRLMPLLQIVLHGLGGDGHLRGLVARAKPHRRP